MGNNITKNRFILRFILNTIIELLWLLVGLQIILISVMY